MKAQPASKASRWQDILAGLSIAGLLLPEAVAYSNIANLPPQAGVIALFAGLLCYGLFGRSRFATVSATSSSAAVLAAATASMSGGDPAHRMVLAVGLVLLTGITFLLAGCGKVGGNTHFIVRPALPPVLDTVQMHCKLVRYLLQRQSVAQPHNGLRPHRGTRMAMENAHVGSVQTSTAVSSKCFMLSASKNLLQTSTENFSIT